MNTHYTPSESGYRIIGSNEFFNRSLYGGHKNDTTVEKYFTLAGDRPIVMGAVTDWRAQPACLHAKCGVFMAGVALTPGVTVPVFGYDGSGERTSQWFHESPGTESTFRNGWMEHRVWPFFQCFPRVEAVLEVLPIQSHDGFIVTLRVQSEQRIHLVIGVGGITGYIGRFEAPYVTRRDFSQEDCVGSRVTVAGRYGTIQAPRGTEVETTVRIGTNLPVGASVANARYTATPGTFLDPDANIGADTDSAHTAAMLRMDCVVDQYCPLEGHVVILRNEPEDALRTIVETTNPAAQIKQQIMGKRSALSLTTPDPMLDAAVPANVLAMDAAWHENTFYHGTFAWHCPYLGWRNWYGPTVLGWHQRVKQAFRTHAETQVKETDRATDEVERVEYTGPAQYAKLHGSYGFLPDIPDGRDRMSYTMQEVGVDMILHNIEWTGDLPYATEMFDVLSDALAWEERILDPDRDGLYQNWLNTFISDAHSYNGGGCAQSSAYNYSANVRMARIAELTGRDPGPFTLRARRIREALHRVLWLPEQGVVAEYVDTVGNKLIHPSPELATIYHCIEAEIVDRFQAYQMLRFTETSIRNETTVNRGGRLAWSSNWYPQNYSSCGLYPAENLHLAWAYYQCGLAEKANEIMTGLVDAHFMSRFPGTVAHCLSPQGYSSGSPDFSEISSMMLRTLVEGLFGVRVRLLDGLLAIAPNFPSSWKTAHMNAGDIEIDYRRSAETETVAVWSPIDADRVIRLPMRATGVADVTVNGRQTEYVIEPGLGRSDVVVTTSLRSRISLRIVHSGEAVPQHSSPSVVARDGRFLADTGPGTAIIELRDPSDCVSELKNAGSRLVGRAIGSSGSHTLFARVRKESWDAWVPIDLEIVEPVPDKIAAAFETSGPSDVRRKSQPLDITAHYNCKLTDIHELEYHSPRPDSYSIMTRLNGRFGWDWNHRGHNVVDVDDGALRSCGGTYVVSNDIPFSTPAVGPNAVCVSVWDNFPESVSFDLDGSAETVAVFFVGVTNPMQSRVENARLVVTYADGSVELRRLVNPDSFDDWLNAAVQTEHETVYFSDCNHGIAARIHTDPSKPLSRLTVTAVANEVIMGIIGITVVRTATQEA